MKRNLYIIIFFLLPLLFPLSVFSKELKKVTLQLSWFDQFQFAGYYIAKEKGIYEQYGLDVEIRPFNFDIDVSSEVEKKNVDFGIGRETLVLEKVSGKKLVSLYALFQESPLVLLSKKDSNIDKIQDFAKKRIMTTINDASEVSIKSMILSKGIKIEDLDFIKHTHNIMDLVNNNTDIISAYLSKTPYDLQQMGIEYNIFNPKDYAFDMYSDFLFTHEDKIKDDLSTVLAFKEASLKGWEYAYSNIGQTAKYMFENFNSQGISLDALIYEAKVLKDLSYTGSNNLGEIRPEKIQRIYDLYNIMGLTPKKIDLMKFVLYKNIMNKIDFTKNEKEYILSKKEVKMCVLHDLKPYSFIQDNKLSGAVSDYIKLINKKTQLDFKHIRTNSDKESYEFLKDGKCDIIPSLFVNERRKIDINFTKPYINLSLVLVTKNDTSFIDDISMLKNKKIGVLSKYAYKEELKKIYPEYNFVELDNIEDAMKKLINSEIFAYTGLLHSSTNEIQNNYLAKLKISGKLDYSLPISIAVIKDDNTLHSILNKSINNTTKEEIDNILQKWIRVEYKKEFDFEILYKFIFIFLVIVIAILYRQRVLKNMNEILKQKVEEKTIALQKINNELEHRVKKEVSENYRKDLLLNKQARMVAMGEMIQNIAHQWRQPLSVISTGASGLQLQKALKGDIDEKFLDETLNTIVETSVDLSATIDSFMNFFKSSKQKNISYINDILEKTLKIFEYNRNEAKIEIIKNIDNVKIISYENELIQILINILNNSKEAFSEIFKDDRFIFIDIKKMGNYLLIKIKDNAGGIDEKDLEKIYDPYFSTKHQYQGTGIGLYMCQEIITQHMNGEIYTKNCDFEYEGNNYTGALTIIKIEINDSI